MSRMNRINVEVKRARELEWVQIYERAEDLMYVEMIGPEDTLYANCRIGLYYQFSTEHPFKPPRINFHPPLLHPNIDHKGYLWIDSITGSQYCPADNLTSNLLNILSLLYEPFICEDFKEMSDKGKEEDDNSFVDECINTEALRLWRTDPEQFKQLLYASTFL